MKFPNGSALAAGFLLLSWNFQSGASDDRIVFVHDDHERSYVSRVPPNLPRDGAKVPLVLVLHGGGGNAPIGEKTSGFTPKAVAEGFIVVYPDGSGRLKHSLLTWNAGHCCGHAMRTRVDDVGFISALIDRLGTEYPIDPARVYVTGMSNGGMMAHRLGRELAGKVAAIAPVVATVFGDEVPPDKPVSAIMFNGMLDKHVPVDGGQTGGPFPDAWDGTAARPAVEQGTFWAKANGCAEVPDEREAEAFRLSSYRCPEGRGVEVYLVKNNGHAWPGGRSGSRRGDTPAAVINATDLMWDFFKAHPRTP